MTFFGIAESMAFTAFRDFAEFKFPFLRCGLEVELRRSTNFDTVRLFTDAAANSESPIFLILRRC